MAANQSNTCRAGTHHPTPNHSARTSIAACVCATYRIVWLTINASHARHAHTTQQTQPQCTPLTRTHLHTLLALPTQAHFLLPLDPHADSPAITRHHTPDDPSWGLSAVGAVLPITVTDLTADNPSGYSPTAFLSRYSTAQQQGATMGLLAMSTRLLYLNPRQTKARCTILSRT